MVRLKFHLIVFCYVSSSVSGLTYRCFSDECVNGFKPILKIPYPCVDWSRFNIWRHLEAFGKWDLEGFWCSDQTSACLGSLLWFRVLWPYRPLSHTVEAHPKLNGSILCKPESLNIKFY